MSINANANAFPVFNSHGITSDKTNGLTKREYFASSTLSGLLSGTNVLTQPEISDAVRIAVVTADMLIKALREK